MKTPVSESVSHTVAWDGRRYSSPSRVPVVTVARPKGLYTSSPSTGSLDNVACRGGLVRTEWVNLETAPGVFNWTTLDSRVATVTSRGKPWSLAVLGGTVGCPVWLSAVATQRYTIKFRTVSYIIAAGWDVYYLQRVQALAQALAARYGNDPLLKLVYVTQATGNGVEGHFNGNTSAELTAQGFTDTKWIDCSKAAARHFNNAFQTKSVAFEVHKILDTHTIPMQIINDLNIESGGKIGAGIWWIKGNMLEQTGLIDALYDYPGHIYAQPIGNSTDTTKFSPASTWLNILTQAQDLGCTYVEAWNQEFEQNTFPAEFASYNSWCDSN